MATLRQQQLKQLNALDRAINNIEKAIKVGEKEETLGYNNGKLAVRLADLIEIYKNQISSNNQDEDIYDATSSADGGY
jgi:hypothetical protein